jgi:hypothetical protein
MAEITQTRQLPAPFIEALGKTYADQLTKQVGKPVDTSKFAPQVAGQDALQTQAATLASSGVGSYQPFLTSAQQALTTAGGLTGSQAYKQFMSPYQQDVIDATLQDFDRQAAMQRQNIGQRAYQSGAFGGGRQGVAEAEYDAASDRNRSSILSGLLQTGFGQAQSAADRAFTQQGSLASAQQGLGQFLPSAQRADIQTLGAVGGIQQSQAQAALDAQQQAAQTAAYEPFQRLNVFGSGVTGLMGGMQSFGDVIKTQPSPSPLQSALGIGTSVAGILGALR